MTQTSLPAARASFVESDGRPTPQFYRFLETLATAQTGNASAADIAAINAQLAALQDEIDALPESSDVPKLQVTYPILSQGLLQNGFAKLAMDQPGDSGTGSLLAFVKDAWGRITGTKAATITGTAGRVTVANGDASAGLPTIDLATVADTGGGSLLRFVRDAWGRVTGTSTPSTTDLAEGSNLYYTNARADARITLQKGQPSGLATLDSGGKLDAGQLPALAITETFVVSTQAAMLALSAQQGDVCVRTDLNDSFILTTNDPTTLANWQELETPVDGVVNFNGRTGSVVPASGDYTTTQVTEGSRLYFTTARVLTTVLAGLSTATNAAITAADSVLSAFGKLQAQISAITATKTIIRASLSSNVSLVPATFTTVVFDTVAQDALGEYSGGIFTASTAGLYLIGSSAQIVNIADGAQLIVGVYVNSVEVARLAGFRMSNPGNPNSTDTTNGGSAVVSLSAGDHVSILVRIGASADGSNATISGIPKNTNLFICRLRA